MDEDSLHSSSRKRSAVKTYGKAAKRRKSGSTETMKRPTSLPREADKGYHDTSSPIASSSRASASTRPSATGLSGSPCVKTLIPSGRVSSKGKAAAEAVSEAGSAPVRSSNMKRQLMVDDADDVYQGGQLSKEGPLNVTQNIRTFSKRQLEAETSPPATKRQSVPRSTTQTEDSAPAKLTQPRAEPMSSLPVSPTCGPDKTHNVQFISSGLSTPKANALETSPFAAATTPTQSSRFAFKSSPHESPASSIQSITSPKRPKGLASRMLKKSATAPTSLSSNASPGSASEASNSVSLLHKDQSELVESSPALSASSSRSRAATPPSHSQHSPAASPTVNRRLAPTVSSKRTYGGGTQRSMLAKMEVDEAEEETKRSESYAVLSKRWGIDQSAEDGGANEDIIDLPTLNGLKARGENQRFLDDLGYIIEGMQGDSVTIRRASGLDLLKRTADAEFRRTIRTVDEAHNLYKAYRSAGGGEGDVILDHALALFLVILAKDGRSIESVLQRSGSDCFGTLGRMLSTQKTEGASKPKNKLEKKQLVELNCVFVTAKIGPLGSQISLRKLASIFFSTIVTHSGLGSPRADRFELLLAEGIADLLSSSLYEEIRSLPEGIRNLEKALPISTEGSSIDLQHVEACLSALEILLLSSDEAEAIFEDLFADVPPLMGTLLAVCRWFASSPSVEENEEEERNASALIGMDCLISTLRFLVNMSTSSSFWKDQVIQAPLLVPTLLRLMCETHLAVESLPNSTIDVKSTDLSSQNDTQLSSFPPSSFIGDTMQPERGEASLETLKVDVACLSLALLNVAVAKSQINHDLIRKIEFNVHCSGNSRCVKECHCRKVTSGLQFLVDFYLSQQRRDTAEGNYMSGYTALLLSHIISDSRSNRELIVKSLPGDGDEQRYDTLISALLGFGSLHHQFYQKVTQIAGISDESGLELPDEVNATTLPATAATVAEGTAEIKRVVDTLTDLKKSL